MKHTTGSHTGTGTWLLQRATAVALAILLPVLLVRGFSAMPIDYTGWHAWLAPAWVRGALLLLAAALALHSWVGMRDILMDYVKPVALRLTLYLVVMAVLAGSLVWLLLVLWRLG
ncbi:MAG: succinate dehydrogenase, hydrophobic membrane anchor protein [Pseudomonadota bacterium]